jgi:hypothetical protein
MEQHRTSKQLEDTVPLTPTTYSLSSFQYKYSPLLPQYPYPTFITPRVRQRTRTTIELGVQVLLYNHVANQPFNNGSDFLENGILCSIRWGCLIESRNLD